MPSCLKTDLEGARNIYKMSVDGKFVENFEGCESFKLPTSTSTIKEIPVIQEIECLYGRVWSWRNGRMFIKHAFRQDGTSYNSSNVLGSPRISSDINAYQAVADWLIAIGINTICGPVLSGAQMAFAITLIENKITPKYLPKEGYVPRKHYSFNEISEPYVIIDDVLESGKTLKEALERTLKWTNGIMPTAIIIGLWASHFSKLDFLTPIRDKLFTVTL